MTAKTRKELDEKWIQNNINLLNDIYKDHNLHFIPNKEKRNAFDENDIVRARVHYDHDLHFIPMSRYKHDVAIGLFLLQRLSLVFSSNDLFSEACHQPFAESIDL